MKIKMKTKLIAILLCAISAITLVCSQLPRFETASASTAVDVDKADIAELEEYADELNQTLAEHGTTADEQLEKLSIELKNEISQTTDNTQIVNLQRLNQITDELRGCAISTYSDSNDFLDGLLDTALMVVDEVARVKITLYLLPAIGLMSLLGYNLTTELLLNGLIMQEVDEPYVPVFGYKVRRSKTFKNIAEGSETSGSTKFPDAYWGNDGDLYLAIHEFSFTKPSSISKTVTITDRYDYHDDKEQLDKFPSIFRPIIRGICLLERLDLFTYYEIEITDELLPKINVENVGYDEVRPTVHANESVDYEVSFSSTSRRLVQTFGDSETELYILSERRKILASDSGNGFNGNSLLSYYFKKDTTYFLRVKFADETKEGSIKLSVICDTRNAESFEGLNLSTIGVGSYTASATAKNVYMVKIAPEETKCYTLTFSPKTSYRAHLIDMSSIDAYSGTYYTSSSGNNGVEAGTAANVGTGASTLTVKLPVTIITYPGGGSDENVIRKTLQAGKQYLLIVCACPANTSSLKVPFKVANS